MIFNFILWLLLLCYIWCGRDFVSWCMCNHMLSENRFMGGVLSFQLSVGFRDGTRFVKLISLSFSCLTRPDFG